MEKTEKKSGSDVFAWTVDFLYHYDCYRLSSGEDAVALGLNDYWEGDNICFIEWPENVAGALPENCKKVFIRKTGDNEREIEL